MAEIIINGLSSQEIIDFYQLLCECETAKKEEWKFKPIQTKTILKQCGITIDKQSTLDGVFPHSSTNKMVFHNTTSTARDILLHIRNSFAHAHLRKENGQYLFEDYANKKELSMYANINCDLYPKFIETLKKLKK